MTRAEDMRARVSAVRSVAPRSTSCLHARVEVGDSADGGVVHMQIGAKGAHDHLARVQVHADAKRNAQLAANLLGVLLDRLLKVRRGTRHGPRHVPVRKG
jgi:hypothetical protein